MAAVRVVLIIATLVVGSVSSAAAPASQLITIQNEGGACLSKAGEYVEWYVCDTKDTLVFQKVPLNTPSQLRTANGKTCLSIIPYGPTKFPDFRLQPCSKSNNNNQLWVLGYGKNKSQIKSMTSLGVCQGPDDSDFGEGPAFISCPLVKSGPVCIDEDEGYASIRTCARNYVAKPVDFVGTPPPDTGLQAAFTAAIAEAELDKVNQTLIGKVLAGHNDQQLTFPKDTQLLDMIEKCYAKCLELKCSEFDVVYNKVACFFSLTGGSDQESKDDANAAAFFINTQ